MELVLYAVIVLGVLGAVFGAILAVASKIFAAASGPAATHLFTGASPFATAAA